MKKIILIVSIFVSILLSCTSKETAMQETDSVEDSRPKNKKKIVSSIGQILIPEAKKMVSNWQDYQELDALMMRYYAVSKDDAYHNAEELTLLTKGMKDSIPVQKLEIDAMKARLNVLHTEALRLKDMASISNISRDELKAQIREIIDAYSATNAKINDLIKVEELEKNMEEFDSEMLEILSKERVESEKNKPKTVAKPKPKSPKKKKIKTSKKKMFSEKKLKLSKKELMKHSTSKKEMHK